MSLALPPALAPLVAAPHRSRAWVGGDLAAPLLRGLFLAIALGLPVIGSALGTWLDGGAMPTGTVRSIAGSTR